MMQDIKMDSYGKILNNKALLVSDEWRTTKMATIASYEFCLALENSIADAYVTEKFYDPLIVGTVPVYLGTPNVDTLAPGDNTFVYVRNFSGPRQLAEYLNHLDHDDDAYEKFYDWRRKPLRQAFQNDLERTGVDLSNLLRVVRQRPALQDSQQPTISVPTKMSFDPFLAGPESKIDKFCYRMRRDVTSAIRTVFATQ